MDWTFCIWCRFNGVLFEENRDKNSFAEARRVIFFAKSNLLNLGYLLNRAMHVAPFYPTRKLGLRYVQVKVRLLERM